MYRSVFLAPDWQHVRYLGWHDSWPNPDFRVLTSRRGPFKRTLAINALDDANRFASEWYKLTAQTSPFAELLLHDLTGSDAVAERLQQDGFSVLAKDERLLNVATFIIGLGPDETELFAALNGDTRRKIRNAEKNGLTFCADAHTNPQMTDRFVTACNAMAEERGLVSIEGGIVRAMLRDGAARLFAVGEQGEGDRGPQSFLLSYETAKTGFFLKGASERGKQNDGAGHLLQWGTIKAFKAAGHDYYDMGGLPARDNSDGIYRFKRGFGGTEIDLGVEYGRSGSAIRIARCLQSWMKGMNGGRRP